MRPELKLIKSTRELVTARDDREIRYRCPLEDVQWEVSCDESADEGPELVSRPARRRAS
ncbi:MAG: hypothetical protein AB7P99_11790 [Vicinamibacterales bacterium]